MSESSEFRALPGYRRWLTGVLGIAALLAIPGVRADEEADVVGEQQVQLDTGMSLERDSRDGVDSLRSTAPFLLRVGLGERWEARVEADGLTVASETVAGRTTSQSGYSDVSLGAKVHLGAGQGFRPGTALLMHVDVASGSPEFRGEGLRPSFRAVAEWELPAEYSLGIMPGIAYELSGQRRYYSGILAATVGKQWNGKLRTYVELSGQQLAGREDGGNVITYDAGAVLLLNPRLEVGTAVSRGANTNSPGWSYGAGLTFKL